METIKINKFEIENVKKIKAVKLEPSKNGLTIVGGKNNQGKTSVLDSLAWVLGGNKFKPSEPQRKESVIPPTLHVVMSNGLVVERKGKNSDLKVMDPNGEKAGQQLLDGFIEELALNLPKFMESNNKEKAETLLQIIGIGDKLAEIELKEKETYSQRHAIGQIADQKRKYALEQEYFTDVPKDLVSASELIKEQQEILARNGENQKKRENANYYDSELEAAKTAFENAQKRLDEAVKNAEIANKSIQILKDESTEELEKNIQEIDELNRKIRINLDKDKAEDDARQYAEQYDSLTVKLEKIRAEKTDLLKSADLPLPELSVEDGELIYKGFKWDNMSSSDQLKVATAIVRKLNPKCGFVLLDQLEKMDIETLNEFGEWLKEEGLQVIATRVSTGEECSIIIEDGYIKGKENSITENEEKIWKEGEF